MDFKQAYDSLHRESLWQILTDFGIPTKLINIIKALYNNTTSRVRVDGMFSSPFTILSGVRQGCLLSPCLFNLALEWVVRQIQRNGTGVRIGRVAIAELAYADDIALIAEKMPELEETFRLLQQTAERIGLNISLNKTKVMHVARGHIHQEGNDIIAGCTIERVESFVYLGSLITPYNDIGAEVERRIGSATRAFYALIKVFKSSLLSRKTKLRILSTIILPVLMYGSETWSLTNTLEKKLLSFENDALKTICGPVYDPEIGVWRRRYAREVRELTQQPLVTDLIRASRLRWLGHVLRAGPDHLIYKVFNENMEGTRPRGRPRTRWRDVTRADLRLLDVDPERMEEVAENRPGWRQIVLAAKGLNGL